ncbi:18080_t:CDS:2 [Cetraspora pellucida]|uniref:18080_t:CDS:1 n=1 Tax=Cetraspora pellucida TaxID=1433469 RepID=A0ACA9K4U2_9GLOM|nr:18080_t:CDS:2 [Cetraspora pellucida]
MVTPARVYRQKHAPGSEESRESYFLGNERTGEDIPSPPKSNEINNPYANITGVAAGVFFVLLWPTGRILVGTLGGFSLAMILLSIKTDGLISDQIGRWIFIGLCSIIMSVAAGFPKTYSYLAIISTVSSGCYCLILGVDVFVRTGILASFKTFWGFAQPDDYRYVVDTHVIIILLTIGILGGMFGVGIQLLELWIRQKNDRSKVEVDDDKESYDSIKFRSIGKKLTNPFKRY